MSEEKVSKGHEGLLLGILILAVSVILSGILISNSLSETVVTLSKEDRALVERADLSLNRMEERICSLEIQIGDAEKKIEGFFSAMMELQIVLSDLRETISEQMKILQELFSYD